MSFISKEIKWDLRSKIAKAMERNMTKVSERVSSYGCGRWEASPYSLLARDAGNAGCLDADGTIRPQAYDAATRTRDTYFGAIAAQHGGNVDSIFAALAVALYWQVILHAVFISAGRQVFQFSLGILADFRRTDLSDTHVGQLTLPYTAGFLHFGLQHDILISDTTRFSAEYVDGAYFHRGIDGALTIQLTLSRCDGGWSKLPGPFFRLENLELKLPAHEAIDLTLNRFFQERPLSADHTEQSKQLIAIEHGFTEWANTSSPTIHASLSLVLNALFYLEAYGADTEPSPSADAPLELTQKFERAVKSGKFKPVREARRALLTQGYTLVRLCGTAIASPRSPDEVDSALNTFRAHWRRGHWRMQPCGPELSSLKRIWIRPVLVSKENATPIMGHEYAVSSSNLSK
jgi:hypothetical protein